MKTRIVNGHEYRDRRSGLDNGDIEVSYRRDLPLDLTTEAQRLVSVESSEVSE